MPIQINYFINGLTGELAPLFRNRVPITFEKDFKYAAQYEGEKHLKLKDKNRRSYQLQPAKLAA